MTNPINAIPGLLTDVTNLKVKVTAGESKDTEQDARLAALEQAFGAAGTRLSTLETNFGVAGERLDNMADAVQAGGDRLTAAEGRFAAGETRLTKLEQGLAKAYEDFTPTAQRVGELSAAAVSFNERLTAIETRLVEMGEAAPPPGEERMAAMEAALAAVSARVAKVENGGQRRGRLSARLAGIEATLERIEAGQGGTEQ